jgi:putative transposase
MRSVSRWRWHLDEVFVKINGVQLHLWRAVDHEGEVLEAFVSKTGDRKAALKLLKKLTKKHGRPEEVMTDGLKSYGAALKEIWAEDRQVTGRCANNRIENSHLLVRRRERAILGFRRCTACRSSSQCIRRSTTSSTPSGAPPVVASIS